MTEKNKGPAPPGYGHHVVAEVARLLAQMPVSTTRGGYAESDHVLVSVLPRREDVGQRFALMVTCLGRGHQAVDWLGLPVFVVDNEGRVQAATLLDSQGQALLEDLPAGRYRLVATPRWQRSPEALPLERPGPWYREYTTDDGCLRVGIGRGRDGGLSVSAEPGESSPPWRAGEALFFCSVAAATGRISRCGKVRLGTHVNLADEGRGLAAAPGEEFLLFGMATPSENASGGPDGNLLD